MQENYDATEPVENTDKKNGIQAITENTEANASSAPNSRVFQLDDTQTRAYEKHSRKYQDTKDSAIALLLVGGFDLLFLVLVFFRILPIALEPFSFSFISTAVLGLIFISFGLLSLLKSQKLKVEAEKEDAATAAVSKWLEEHIDASIVDTSENLSEADLYFLRCQRIKELLSKNFPDADEDYLDVVLDENYDKLFDEK